MEEMKRRPGEDAKHYASRCKLRGMAYLALGDEAFQARGVWLDALKAECEAYQVLENPSEEETEAFSYEAMACLHHALVETGLVKKLPRKRKE